VGFEHAREFGRRGRAAVLADFEQTPGLDFLRRNIRLGVEHDGEQIDALAIEREPVLAGDFTGLFVDVLSLALQIGLIARAQHGLQPCDHRLYLGDAGHGAVGQLVQLVGGAHLVDLGHSGGLRGQLLIETDAVEIDALRRPVFLPVLPR
jgi:hypothetical protein